MAPAAAPNRPISVLERRRRLSVSPPSAGRRQPPGFTMEIDSTGALYVPDPGTNRIYKFAPSSYDGMTFTAGELIGWMGRCDSGPNCDDEHGRSFGYSCTDATCSVAPPAAAARASLIRQWAWRWIPTTCCMSPITTTTGCNDSPRWAILPVRPHPPAMADALYSETWGGPPTLASMPASFRFSTANIRCCTCLRPHHSKTSPIPA